MDYLPKDPAILVSSIRSNLFACLNKNFGTEPKVIKNYLHGYGFLFSDSYLIGADNVKKAKPEPEPVLNTLSAMNYEASETLVVGDMAVDILMGVSAGAKTCGVIWG